MFVESSNADIEQIVLPRLRDGDCEGGVGFAVRRALPATRRRMVGPFVLVDRFESFAPPHDQGIAIAPHPHIGLAALTYLFAGQLVHRDSAGVVAAILPGAANLMIAGRGIVHSERGTGAVCGVQCWMALPRRDEEAAPSFEHVPASGLPCIEGEGIRLRLIAGALHGRCAPTRMLCDLVLADVALADGARFRIDAQYAERAVYITHGAVAVGGQSGGFASDRMIVFRPGAEIVLRAQGAARMLLLGGEKLPEKRHIAWNFVSSRRERIEQAARDWRDGRFGTVPGEAGLAAMPDSAAFRL
jgi:redox-sensitive bicupin YhaK (pirin superfamily)